MENLTTPQTTTTTNLVASRQKVEQLFTLNTITEKDIENFTPHDREYLAETCAAILAQLEGTERDNFLDKISQVIPPYTKSDIWEYNHQLISQAISTLMSQQGVMPTKNAVAECTGLSRQTVAKHFATYNHHPEFEAQMEQFKFMAPNLLASIFKHALTGDMRAAKLYLQMVGTLNKKQEAAVTEQNNYIQINNTILSQQNLKQLTEAQLNQIESIINNKGQKKLLEAI